MNIFASYFDPQQCAVALDDKRLNKMVVETAQLLSTAIRIRSEELGRPIDGVLYKRTHENHPCAIWGRANRSNYDWLLTHFDFLCDEYEARFKKLHACREKLKRAFHMANGIFSIGEMTPFANCTEFKEDVVDVHEAYRLQLTKKWLGDIAAGRPPKWTNRDKPEFYVDQGILMRAQEAILKGDA